MAGGHPLTDDDRAPWLAALRRRIEQVIDVPGHIVVACSALKHSYRSALAGNDPEHVRFVELDVPAEVLRERLEHRDGHFMPASLIESQLATLEPSKTALRLDGTLPVATLVGRIMDWLWR
jgi:carbohydrate kinase (thermoresistant glucokinase family)